MDTERMTQDAFDASDRAPEFEAITSQEQLDRVLSDRLAHERAKHADYDDLKAMVAKLDRSRKP